MPILPENKGRYPVDWKAIRDRILEECQNKCEFCGVENHTMRGGKKIVLTIAHLDHVPEHCARENLRALCQKCHNTYDAKHRAQTRRQSKMQQLLVMARVMMEERERCEP
jgi:5-methylcytosine-specific restriction endonuclease McrA